MPNREPPKIGDIITSRGFTGEVFAVDDKSSTPVIEYWVDKGEEDEYPDFVYLNDPSWEIVSDG